MNVTLTGITHVTNTSGCAHTFSLSLMQPCAVTYNHIMSQSESTQIGLFASPEITALKQIVS